LPYSCLPKTVHVLMECPKQNLRETMLCKERSILRNSMDLRLWLAIPEQAKKVTRFMMATNLLAQFRAVTSRTQIEA
jgi:hypothetical protein